MTLTLRPWQQEIYDMISIANPERIIWICDNTGNAGKTTFAHHMYNTSENGTYFLHYENQNIIQQRGDIFNIRGAIDRDWNRKLFILDLYAIPNAVFYNTLSNIRVQYGIQQIIILSTFLPDVQFIDPESVQCYMCNDQINLQKMCYTDKFQIIGG